MRTYLLVLESLRHCFPGASDELRQYAAMARVSNYYPGANVVRLRAAVPPEAWRKAGGM